MTLNNRRLTLYSFVYRGLSSGLAFINSVMAARYLPKADRGDFQLSTTIATLGQSFSGGYTNYFSYALPRRPEDRELIVQMGNFVMYIFSILVWLASFAVAYWLHPSIVVMYALIGMPLTFLFGYGSKLLNSLGQISWLNRANMAQASVFLILYAAFIVAQPHAPNTERLLWTFRIWILSWAICVVMTLIVAYRALGTARVLKWRWSAAEWRGLRSYGTASSLAIVTGYVNYRTDYWMLLITRDPNVISTYGVAVAAAEILNTLTQTISTMVFHRVTAATSDDAGQITEVASRQTLITSTFGGILLALVLPLLVLMYGWSKYGGSVGPFYVLLPGLVLKATANVIAQYFTNAKGKPLTLMWVNLMVIAVNALVCLFLIPLMGMYGASISSTLSYVFELWVYVYWYNRVSNRKGKDLWRLRRSDWATYTDLLGGLQRRLAKGQRETR
ncbi:lipopolysaccharide biosynthesis protein [Alicyclobacillus acidiphilus]|uniref:lipopolysaccharide biosynthesis protein n=1 Tax=Alicyclobacillus acidiphilus TaxID=182455 RepID=UPI000836FDAD|nr:polysaccharide biosynthesis C-terminal domain-containing protein [Alicyclobacillus acidiphilus]